MKHPAAAVLQLSLPLFLVSCASATANPVPPMPTNAKPTADLPSPFPTKELPKNAPVVIDQDEQAIYSQFLQGARGTIPVVRQDTMADTFPQNEKEARQIIRSNLPSVSDATLDNYLSINSKPSTLPPNMNIDGNYILISTPEFLEITSNSDWRTLWSQRFPNSDAGCIAFSRIGFNDSHTQALLYVTNLWVDGGYYLLTRNEHKGMWEITERFINVITN